MLAVLSTQEELGPRNSKVTFHHIKPDIPIVMEGFLADDTSQNPTLKKGPMFRHMDISAICAPRHQRWVLDLAAKKGIPVRYTQTTNCISGYFDFEIGVQLVMPPLENITEEVIRGL